MRRRTVKRYKVLKPRNPAAILRSKGVLRERVIGDKKKITYRKRKHKGNTKG